MARVESARALGSGICFATQVKRKHVIEAARSLPRTPPIQPAFESHHHDEEASSYGTTVSRGTRAGMRRCGTSAAGEQDAADGGGAGAGLGRPRYRVRGGGGRAR